MSNTTRHDRRFLLMAGGAGVASLAAPAWIQSAFAGQAASSSGKDSGPETLARALERATAIGKPLLVIVLPVDDLRLERGRLWGDLLGYAPEAAMADFALCEWTCASSAEIVSAYRDLEDRMTRETVAVLIETGDAPEKTRLVSFRTGDLPAPPGRSFPVHEMQKRAQELAVLLQAAILPAPDAWQARHTQCMKAVRPGDDLGVLYERSVRPRLHFADRYAGFVRAMPENSFFVRAMAESGFNVRERCTAVLAQAAALRLWESGPAGATWNTEHVDPCPGCGMGRADGTSRAFLEFLTAKGR